MSGRDVWLGSLVACLLWWCVLPALSLPGEVLYEQLITTTAHRHGLEPAVVKAVIKCESRFDPRAQSPRGAQGLMQLMPSTQVMLGVNDAFDPYDNVAAGTQYLATLKQTFGGNLQLALAAYNAGPQTVITAGYAVPAIAETQQYVRCVQVAYEHYRQPGAASLGFNPRSGTPRQEGSRTLQVNPLRLSSEVAQVGQRLTVQVEATNTSKRSGHGVVMLNYPEHLVSFMALHTTGHETTVQLPAAVGLPAPPGASPTAYQLLWSHWPTWAPGERRTATIALVPRLPQDITLHLSVVLDEVATSAASQRWSSIVRIPFHAAALVDRALVRYTSPRR